jgi:tetratricopeptide (TPR) repeat protein
MREDVPQDAGRSPFAARPAAEAAYFLDLLGDGHVGLGRHEAAIEAYQQAAEGFRAAGAQCSYALCLFKIADSHLALAEPWHAVGYLDVCLPLLTELGLVRHGRLARQRLAECQAGLAAAPLADAGPGPDVELGRDVELGPGRGEDAVAS